jgi:predicted dehydrogenase
MKTLRAAVIGVGYLGRFHAEKLASMPGVQLVAVVDTDIERARTIAAAHGCEAYADHHALLGAVEAACVVVPTALHHVVAGDFLRAGAHVLVEKPIARTLAEADSLVALAKTHARILQVGHLQRFNPAFRALERAIGRPIFIETERLAGFKDRGVDVDVVLDLMIHDLDLVLAMAKSDVVSVSACGAQVLTDSIDVANARLEFADGCVANLAASRASQSAVRKLRAFHAGGYVSADLQAGRLRLVRRGSAAAGVAEQEIAFDDRDELRAEIEAFVAAIAEGGRAAVSGDDGRRALALALEVGRLVRERQARFAAATRETGE